uniref:Uncharacterized protein n=1 Tax=Octopus bimaculoides TaxID=37653 RepID=A0A0L8GR95_OCTBM
MLHYIRDRFPSETSLCDVIYNFTSESLRNLNENYKNCHIILFSYTHPTPIYIYRLVYK